jgi:hypothetical protein
MIRLTSLYDLITSLTCKGLGNYVITFTVYTKFKDNVLFEFECASPGYKYRFVISRIKDTFEDVLRVYDNGNIYLINNFFPENYPDEIDWIISKIVDDLNRYYHPSVYVDKIDRYTEANVYKMEKRGIE